MIVGIDASRNRSGGAKVHLIGILRESDPVAHGITQVHLWSYRSLLDAVPDASWLVKHKPPALERSLPCQMWWQRFTLPGEARALGCRVLLNTDAGSICAFHPSVTMSRDMLSYEGCERHRYGLARARLRLELLRHVQARSLRHSEGAVFLTRYAARVIQEVTGSLPRVAIIPHGVSDSFRRATTGGDWDASGRRIRCLYVSNTAPYKHQWHVVRAIGQLRRDGRDVELTLVGGGTGPTQARLAAEIARTDPERTFVRSLGAVAHDELPQVLASADVFIFASSCENMPNTLVEAMATGLPIACSDRGPMPEVLADGGVYFDPEDPASIARAVAQLIDDRERRVALATRAWELSAQFSWSRCGRETWEFLRRIATAAGSGTPSAGATG